MDTRDSDDRRRTGAVKAAVNMFGERTTSKKPHTEVVIKPFNFLISKSSSRTTELHMAKRDIARYRERRRSAEFVNVQAEAELSQAKRAVKVLASQIEESNAKFMAKKKETEESLMTNSKIDDAGSSGGQKSDRYLEVMKELEFVKSELSKLKLGMASVLEEKAQAEKVANNSQFTQQSETDTVEALRKEIDEANEEHVLVELATIEALKEKEEIEAQRQKESSEFSAAVEEKRKKMNEAIEEIDSSKEMESKLAVTLFDAGVLHNELRLAKEMEMKIQRSNSMRSSGSVSRRIEQGSEGSPMLKSIKNELEAAKKELATVKEEGFQFMASMDIIRNELQHVKEEAARLEKEEEKADVTVQNLNSKLLRGKSKLDAAISAEEKAKSILSNLNLTLEQLMTEAEVAKKEKELIGEETTNIKVEIHKTETEIDITEEKLEAAMEELEQIKVSEALAMRKLQDLIENAMRARASASEEGCSTINLSRFEYEYLTGRAGKAEEIADKKVAAAQAWIEALNASEKEILMKVEMAHREIREMKVEEEREALGAAERSKRTAGEGGGGGGGHRQSKGRKKSVSETPRKPHRTSSSGNLTPTRRLKLRNTEFTPSRTTPRSVSVPIKKRKASVPNLSKMLMWQEK
ncbi:Protein PLASTID MOVEMENT IMPAIRED 2 [Linum perenne]